MSPTPAPTPSTSQVFDALAHPARLEIIELLRDGEVCVCHIQAKLNQRQAYISQHLNVLRRLGLVSSRKDGLRVYYQVSDPQLFQVVDAARRLTGSTGSQGKNLSQPCACPQCFEHRLEASHA